jgi:hypothetical protein
LVTGGERARRSLGEQTTGPVQVKARLPKGWKMPGGWPATSVKKFRKNFLPTPTTKPLIFEAKSPRQIIFICDYLRSAALALPYETAHFSHRLPCRAAVGKHRHRRAPILGCKFRDRQTGPDRCRQGRGEIVARMIGQARRKAVGASVPAATRTYPGASLRRGRHGPDSS